MQYAVDIVFEAFDESNATFESILERGRQIEAINQKLEKSSGGAAGGGASGNDAVSRIFSGISNRFLAVEALQAGMHGIKIAASAWAYEQDKIKNTLVQSLDQQLQIRENVKGLIRDLPFVGRLAVEIYDVFNRGKDPIKEMRDMAEGLERSLGRTGDILSRMRSSAKMAELENADAPGSAKEAERIRQDQAERQKEMQRAQADVTSARTLYNMQREREDKAAKMREMIANTGAEYAGDFVTITPDRIESNKAAEKLKKAQQRLSELASEERRTRGIEEQRIFKMQTEEQQKKKQAQDRLFEDRQKKEKSAVDWVMQQQQQRLDELEAGKIKDRFEKEKQLIDIKYRYEIQRAKDAGYDIGLLEKQRAAELDGLRPDQKSIARMFQGQTAASEVRYMSYGDGRPQNYLNDIAGHGKRQSDLLAKISRNIERLAARLSAPGMSQPVSNFR